MAAEAGQRAADEGVGGVAVDEVDLDRVVAFEEAPDLVGRSESVPCGAAPSSLHDLFAPPSVSSLAGSGPRLMLACRCTRLRVDNPVTPASFRLPHRSFRANRRDRSSKLSSSATAGRHQEVVV